MGNLEIRECLEESIAGFPQSYIPSVLQAISNLGALTLGECTFIYELQALLGSRSGSLGLLADASVPHQLNLSGSFTEAPSLTLLSNQRTGDILLALPTVLSTSVRFLSPVEENLEMDELYKHESDIRKLLVGDGEDYKVSRRERAKLEPLLANMTTIKSIAPIATEYLDGTGKSMREERYLTALSCLSSMLAGIIPTLDDGLPGLCGAYFQYDQSDAQGDFDLEIRDVPHFLAEFENNERAANQSNVAVYSRTNESWPSSLHGVTILDRRIAEDTTRTNYGDEFLQLGQQLESMDFLGEGPNKLAILAKTELLKSLILAMHPYEASTWSFSQFGVDLEAGTFVRCSPSPEDSFSRSATVTEYHQETVDVFELNIPKILKKILRNLSRLGAVDSEYSFAAHCEVIGADREKTLDQIMESIQSKWYMAGLAKDQYANQLPLFLTAMNFSLADNYWYSAKANHRPPVNTYYETSSTEELSTRLNKIVEHYFSGGTTNV